MVDDCSRRDHCLISRRTLDASDESVGSLWHWSPLLRRACADRSTSRALSSVPGIHHTNLQRGRARRGCVTSRRATERVASEVGRAKMDRGMRA